MPKLARRNFTNKIERERERKRGREEERKRGREMNLWMVFTNEGKGPFIGFSIT